MVGPAPLSTKNANRVLAQISYSNNMAKITTILITLLAILPVHAEEGSCPSEEHRGAGPQFECEAPDEGELLPDISAPDAIPVRANMELIAPWDGALVHRDHLVRIRMRVLVLRRLRWLDHQEWLEQQELELRTLAQIHQAQTAASREANLQLKEELKDERARSHRRIWVLATVGVVSAIALLTSITLYVLGGVL